MTPLTTGSASSHRLDLTDGWVDLRLGRVFRVRRSQALTSTEVSLLRYLADRAGVAVSRDEILDAVWGYQSGVVTRTLDTAVYRLRKKIERDPSEPEHVHTVHGHGYRFEFGGGATNQWLTNQGPTESGATSAASRLFGRDALLARIQADIRAGASVIALVGPGGVGKTSLAHELLDAGQDEWTLRTASHYRSDRGLFCSIVEASRESDLVRLIARALLAPAADRPQAAPTPPQLDAHALGGLLADAAPDLLVLDNAEQVVEPLRALLTEWRSFGVPPIVVTSRVPLGVWGERVVPVPALGPEDGAALLRRAAAQALGEAMTLPWSESTEELRPIAEHLEGLPLALELVAPRLSVLSPRQLLESLHSPGMMLDTGADSTRPERQRTLRHVIAWSWQLLDAAERSCLMALSVFRGGCTLPAIRAVCPADAGGSLSTPTVSALVDALDALRRHNLVVVQRPPGDDPRYTLAMGVREFAHDQAAEQGHLPALFQAHAQYFAEFMETGSAAAAPGAYGPIDAEAENLTAVVQRTKEAGAAALEVARGLGRFLMRRGPLDRASELLRMAAQATESEADAATLWTDVAEVELLRGRHEAAHAALGHINAPQDSHMASRLAVLHGRLQLRTAKPAQALDTLRQGLALAEAAGAQVQAGLAVAEIGSAQYELGRFDDALDSYRRGVRQLEAAGEAVEANAVRVRQGIVELDAGLLTEAAVSLQDALRVAKAMGDRRREAVVRSHLGVLEHERGELDGAAQMLDVALGMHQTLGQRRFVGFALSARGLVALQTGDLSVAEEFLHEALGVFRQIPDRRFEAVTIARIGLLEVARGRPDLAEVRWRDAHQQFKEIACDWGTRGVQWLRQPGSTATPRPSQFERLNAQVYNQIS